MSLCKQIALHNKSERDWKRLNIQDSQRQAAAEEDFLLQRVRQLPDKEPGQHDKDNVGDNRKDCDANKRLVSKIDTQRHPLSRL